MYNERHDSGCECSAAFYSDGRYFLFYVVASPEEGAAAAATHVGFSEKGDKIITMGGMYGTLTNVGPVKVMVKLTEGVEIEFARTAISAFQDPDKMERAEKGEL